MVRVRLKVRISVSVRIAINKAATSEPLFYNIADTHYQWVLLKID